MGVVVWGDFVKKWWRVENLGLFSSKTRVWLFTFVHFLSF